MAPGCRADPRGQIAAAARRPPPASVVCTRSEPATGGRSGTVTLAGFQPWLPGIFEKSLHVVTAKAFYSPDRVTRQFASSDHAVDGHRRELQQVGELANGIEFGLGVVFRL